MKKENPIPKGYVSASIKRLRRKLNENPDETKAFKDNALATVDMGVEDFSKRLARGEVQIASVADFERLVKLGLLLHGEATEKVEHTTDVEEITDSIIEDVSGTEEFDEIRKRIAESMNARNEKG